MPLWLCLDLPRLPLEALSPSNERLAVTARRGNRRWIVASSAEIEPGTEAGTAAALIPGLVLTERKPAAERVACRAIALWAYHYSSRVSWDIAECAELGAGPRAAVWVELSTSLKLFDGLESLLAKMREDFSALGYTARWGLAPAPEAAAALARAGITAPALNPEQMLAALHPLPLAVLALPQETLQTLAGFGCRKLGQVLELPADALARRFDFSVTDYLDRLRGRYPDPRPCITPPPRYRRRFELLGDVENTEGLLFPLRRLLQELAAYLRARDTGLREFTLELVHAGGARTPLVLNLSAPSRDPARFELLLRHRFERVHLQAPVRELVLRAEHFAVPGQPQGDLFDSTQRKEEDYRQLLEALLMRLGPEAVFSLGLVEDHRPEKGWKRAMPDAALHAPAIRTAPRPTWLLDPPRPLTIPPRELTGAERIETGWQDGGDVQRDYYVAGAGTGGAGPRLWVFQDRASGGWYLQGLFA